jgi:hypothetical protein
MIVTPMSDSAKPSDVRKVFDLPDHGSYFLRALPGNWGVARALGKPIFRWGEAATTHQVAKPRQIRFTRSLSSTIRLSFAVAMLPVAVNIAYAQTKITIDHNTGSAINPEFKFKSVPSPSGDDVATKARVLMVDGEADGNSAGIEALTDGVLPTSDDQPRRNFFITAGSGGARLLIDLGRVIEVAQINSYSWHPNSRAPQVYRVWASDGSDAKFMAEPKANMDPRTVGWRILATVDTRYEDADADGGQYGVSISDARGSLGRFRYLLFDCYVTEVADNFGNTFYSEIDVVAKK